MLRIQVQTWHGTRNDTSLWHWSSATSSGRLVGQGLLRLSFSNRSGYKSRGLTRTARPVSRAENQVTAVGFQVHRACAGQNKRGPTVSLEGVSLEKVRVSKTNFE